jgi:nicotinamide-nucleotide amidase
MLTHTHAAILSTGDEIVLGQLQDSNARWFAERLTAAGIVPRVIEAVGDDLETLARTIRRLADECPLLIMSGGLGPTDGDLTRPALARVLGDELVLDDAADRALAEKLASRGRSMTDRLRRQAFRPARAACLPNRFGTAPGLYAQVPVSTPAASAASDRTGVGGVGGVSTHRVCEVFCLPGPPGELRPMFDAEVRPRLRPDPARAVRTRLLQVIALAESDAVQRLGELTKRDRQPLVGVTASGGQLTVRIRYEGPAGDGADAAMTETEQVVRRALEPHVFGRDEQTLPEMVLAALRPGEDAAGAAPQSLVVAESCTGGLLGRLLADVPGASDVFQGGWITYANRAKEQHLGVPGTLIEQHGAVSAAVARAMALGAIERSGADHALAITGVAGPGGGSEQKPVGLVYVAHARRQGPAGPEAQVRRLLIPGDREDVRNRAARSALALLWFALKGQPAGQPPLLWERPEA